MSETASELLKRYREALGGKLDRSSETLRIAAIGINLEEAVRALEAERDEWVSATGRQSPDTARAMVQTAFRRIEKLEARIAELEGQVRPEVMEFAKAMEEKLRGHDADRGDSWKTCRVTYLADGLVREFEEMELAYQTNGPYQDELPDIGNYAMFLWNRKRIERGASQ